MTSTASDRVTADRTASTGPSWTRQFAELRHGPSTVTAGTRTAPGIIVHDAPVTLDLPKSG